MRTATLLRTATVAIALLLATVTMRAEVPGAVISFTSEVKTSILGSPYVSLSWEANAEGGRPTRFDVLQGSVEANGSISFDSIGSVQVSLLGSLIGRRFTFNVQDLDSGVHTFAVIAVNAEGSSDSSNILTVDFNSTVNATLKFISQPILQGVEDVDWTYLARAVPNVAGTVRYSLEVSPTGMTIDSVTGLVTFASPDSGSYDVKIDATLEVGGLLALTTSQSFTITIHSDSMSDDDSVCATISGTVKMSDGTLALSGKVEAWRINADGGILGDVSNLLGSVFTAAIADGSFSLDVPEGDYRLKVKGSTFLTEWWTDATRADSSLIVTATCDIDVTGINFVVGTRDTASGNVSGRITDALTGEGIRGLVSFFPRLLGGFNLSLDSILLDSNAAFLTVATDANGEFSATLPIGASFIASARATGNAGVKYGTEFFPETTDATLAEVLTIGSVINNLNFTLTPTDTARNNGLRGRLVDNLGRSIRGTIMAFLAVARDSNVDDTTRPGNGFGRGLRDAIAAVRSNLRGEFEFRNLIQGEYILFAVPDNRPLVPGYFVSNFTASTVWQNASRITVGDYMLESTHDIILDAAVENRGRATLVGEVVGSLTGGIVARDHKNPIDAPQATNGIPGALIVVRDESGMIIDYAMTYNNGAFVLEQMSNGENQVVIDRFGYTGSTAIVAFENNNAFQLRTFTLAPIVTDVEIPEVFVGSEYNLYPNPANTTTTLKFNALAGDVRIRVVDMTGTVVSEHSTTVDAGSVSLPLTLQSQPTGMLMIHVTNGTKSFALPLSIVR